MVFKVEYKLVALIIDKGLCNVYGFVSFEPSVTEASLRTPLTSHWSLLRLLSGMRARLLQKTLTFNLP